MRAAELFGPPVRIAKSVVVALAFVIALRSLVLANGFLIGSVFEVAIAVQFIKDGNQGLNHSGETAPRARHRLRPFGQAVRNLRQERPDFLPLSSG
ncbi:hypothetical protein OCUBac02_07880 [Bosea sp. ANAM02]|nr:hypothetical protein OCUBac02_07880 [Bosea sp. ANAM02]